MVGVEGEAKLPHRPHKSALQMHSGPVWVDGDFCFNVLHNWIGIVCE